MFRLPLAVTFCITTVILSFAAQAQESHGQDKHLDVRSSVGDLHLGNDATARKAGLPLYPGARPHRDQQNSDALNLGAFTEAFGIKLVVAVYDSDDAPAKIIDYYREQLKKYGKVLECHTREHGGDTHTEVHDEAHSKELKCEGDNTGPVTELKVGTEDNQHAVSVEPREGHSGSTFSLVYVHARGKQGDI
jgi:hypothetical protein